MDAYIITYRFFDFDNNQIKIGGVETYIHDLARLLTNNGYNTTVYILKQSKSDCKEQLYHGFKICEFQEIKNNQKSFDKIYSKNEKGLYIIITDDMGINTKGKRNVITIQHGIPWDCPEYYFNKSFLKQKHTLFIIKKIRDNIKRVIQSKRSSNIVAVDYNYYNWLCACFQISDSINFTVIPNHVQNILSIKDFDKKLERISNLSRAKLVFARRMTDCRGTLLFARVAKRLFKEFPEIDITMAGEGPMLDDAKSILKNEKNIHFTLFNSENSIDFHQQFDIAVVPSVYSEGTSLSLLEAMAAGCFPVSTHVGGLTNIIIDGFNGKLCYPNEDSVFDILKSVLNMDIEEYRHIIHLSYETIQRSFFKDIWEVKWLRFLNLVVSNINQ